MRVLYIDTSSSYLYTGVVEDGKLLCEVKKELAHNLSKDALPLIADMFEKVGIEPREIDKIIVVNGPGSFTGIRVGLTIAKVYAWSLNIPITTILSLEAMATSSEKRIKVPIIDALKGNVYAAIYDGEKEVLTPRHISLEELKKKLEKFDECAIISNDKDILTDDMCSYDPNIVEIVKKYVDKDSINPHLVNPEYLKLSSAEEAKKRD